jgi:hypothetical protein
MSFDTLPSSGTWQERARYIRSALLSVLLNADWFCCLSPAKLCCHQPLTTILLLLLFSFHDKSSFSSAQKDQVMI